ncbi:MAG: cyclodeaminase/cyclohydrolase family protein [Thermodesulfobacteriota bacterium]
MEMEVFLESLAASNPTPGGGSASALAGALSAALIAMVAGLSLKNDKEMKDLMKKAILIQKRLYRAIEEDARSFEDVLKAFRLPRQTDRERFRRTMEIQKAYRKATLTPQLVCEKSLQLLEYSKHLIRKGNPNAMSDAGVAAFLADASLAGGLLNIGVNLAQITDQSFVKKMRLLMKKWTKRRNHLMEGVLKAFKKI